MAEQATPFDVLVIGAGPGGYVCAIRAAQLGLKTACVEMEPTLGGTCLNVGCIPSKALLESSHHFERTKEGLAEHGILVKDPRLDLARLLARKDGVVKSITAGVDYLFKKNKITWLKGRGSFTAEKQVCVTAADGTQTTYAAAHIIIATGSTPIALPFAPFDKHQIVDSTAALNFPSVPEHLVVIGGGVIGLELGSVWRRLGAKVTVVEAQDHLLGQTDLGLAQELLKILRKQGLEILLSTKVSKITAASAEAEAQGKKSAATPTLVSCQKENGETCELQADRVLVAIGRKPRTQELGLEKLGVTRDERGFIVVDQHFQTSLPGVYAIGDCIPGPMLAHKAEEEGIALAELLAGKAGHVNYQAIASIVYTWPEVASVGLSEEQCKAAGLPYRTGKFFFKANGRAKAMGESEGFVKMLAHKESDALLGVHIIGPQASELIAEAAIALEYKASAEDLARSVHAHPTLAETLKEAALDVEKRAIHA